ncbi:MAG TPA: hypothetical protein VGR57_12210 [Ktedonobacterales bacterium]|nr:hypothetical protein [Ktedonobacterales bacterium]
MGAAPRARPVCAVALATYNAGGDADHRAALLGLDLLGDLLDGIAQRSRRGR